jgi:hypothetical protein
MRPLRPLLLAALLLGLATPALAAPDDGFAAFWAKFAAAVAKDDQAALAGMVVIGPGLYDDAPHPTFAMVHAAIFKPSQRKCLAAAHPDSQVDGNGAVEHAAYCGQLIYVFTKSGGAWKLTDMSAND